MNNEQLDARLKTLENELDINTNNNKLLNKMSFSFSPFNLALGARDPAVKDIDYFQIYFIALIDALKSKRIDLDQYVNYRHKLMSTFNKKLSLSQQATSMLLLNFENSFGASEDVNDNAALKEAHDQLISLYNELHDKEFMDKDYLDSEIKCWASVCY